MIPSNRVSTHPGVILLKEFLEPLELSQTALAAHVGISVQRVNEIVRGKRGITPETARLAASAGANVFVAGTAIFGAANPSAAVAELRRAIGE